MNERQTQSGTASSPWDDFRRQVLCAENWAYFDHAAVAPLTVPARDAIVEWANDVAANGAAHWLNWADHLKQTRQSGARLLGANPSEIALIRNTTEGINLVAEGFPWRPGDNLVTLGDEFPSNLYPWMNLADRGVTTRLVPVERGQVDLDRIAEACDEHTRMVAVSWVGYASGWRNDVDRLLELAHDRGAYLFLDAIQGLGVFPLDVRKTPVDFLAADGHKWLLGPEGAGLFYLRQEHLDMLRPLGVGWNSVAHYDFSHIELKLKQAAARYEGGTYNVAGLVGLGASLNLLAQSPIEQLANRLLEITAEVSDRLASLGATVFRSSHEAHRSGIVSFELPGKNPMSVRKQCRATGVILACRAGRLRVSPHVYTNSADIDRLIAALSD